MFRFAVLGGFVGTQTFVRGVVLGKRGNEEEEAPSSKRMKSSPMKLVFNDMTGDELGSVEADPEWTYGQALSKAIGTEEARDYRLEQKKSDKIGDLGPSDVLIPAYFVEGKQARSPNWPFYDADVRVNGDGTVTVIGDGTVTAPDIANFLPDYIVEDILYGGEDTYVAVLEVASPKGETVLFSGAYDCGTGCGGGEGAPIQTVVARESKLTALKTDGSVVIWGDSDSEITESQQEQLRSGVKEVFANNHGFAALKEDGSAIQWGSAGTFGGRILPPNWSITGVTKIVANREAFAALKTDGTVETWGYRGVGGGFLDTRGLTNVKEIRSVTASTFEFVREDGSVIRLP